MQMARRRAGCTLPTIVSEVNERDDPTYYQRIIGQRSFEEIAAVQGLLLLSDERVWLADTALRALKEVGYFFSPSKLPLQASYCKLFIRLLGTTVKEILPVETSLTQGKFIAYLDSSDTSFTPGGNFEANLKLELQGSEAEELSFHLYYYSRFLTGDFS